MRALITSGRLYALLTDELARRRSCSCTTCMMPLPYRVSRPDSVSANWRIGTPSLCDHGCDVVIGEIVTAMWPRYDVAALAPLL